MDKLIDDALVGSSHVAERLLVRVGDLQKLCLIAPVRGGGNHVELGGLGSVVAGEEDFLRAHGDVEAVLVAKLVDRAVDGDLACTADIEDADLAALQEIVGAEVCPNVDALVDGDGLLDGHAAERHHAVDMAVYCHNGIGNVQVFDQEFLPELFGGIAFYIIRVCCVTDIHVLPPYSMTFSVSPSKR